MKKIGFLLFVIVLLLGCQKKNTPDEDFQIQVEELQNDFGIFIFENIENELFWPIELLEKDTMSDLGSFFDKKINRNSQFPKSKLSRKNKAVNRMIQLYFSQKRIQDDNGDTLDSLNIFSIINDLNATVQNKKYTNEEQFFQVIVRLEEVPIYFSKAKELIKKPIKQKLENAIQQYSQDYFYLKNELPLLLRKPDILKEDQIDFSQKNEEAQLAVKDFIAFLNSQLFELGNR